jgi:hypothetical protein
MPPATILKNIAHWLTRPTGIERAVDISDNGSHIKLRCVAEVGEAGLAVRLCREIHADTFGDRQAQAILLRDHFLLPLLELCRVGTQQRIVALPNAMPTSQLPYNSSTYDAFAPLPSRSPPAQPQPWLNTLSLFDFDDDQLNSVSLADAAEPSSRANAKTSAVSMHDASQVGQVSSNIFGPPAAGNACASTFEFNSSQPHHPNHRDEEYANIMRQLLRRHQTLSSAELALNSFESSDQRRARLQPPIVSQPLSTFELPSEPSIGNKRNAEHLDSFQPSSSPPALEPSSSLAANIDVPADVPHAAPAVDEDLLLQQKLAELNANLDRKREAQNKKKAKTFK